MLLMDDKIYNFFQLSQAKGVKIVHLNIRSLVKKIDQLRLIIEGSNIDIITLSESWLHQGLNSQLISVQGYKLFRLDRSTHTNKKRGGGLVTYVRDSLDVYVHETNSTSSKDIEVQWLCISKDKSKDIIIGNVYRPPTGNLSSAIKTLEEGITSLSSPSQELVILGDFNVDYKNQKSPNFKKIKFFERANSLDQKISNATRNTKHSSTLLDVIFTNIKYVKAAGTLDSFLSDHLPIFLLKKKSKNTAKVEQNFQGRSYKNYNKQEFSENISNKNWSSFYDAPDPSAAWHEMLQFITEEADKMCPMKSFRIRNSKPCWLTNELLEQMKDRDYFYRKAKRTNDEDDWNMAKFHRNQTNFNIRRAKADYIKDQLRNNEGNSAKFWRTIKNVMPSKKGNQKSNTLSLRDDNDELVGNHLLAEYVNSFFANIGTPNTDTTGTASFQSQAGHDGTVGPVQGLDSPPEEGLLELTPVTKFEVETIIKKINISKSSGITFISSRILRDSFQELIDKLVYLFNFSIKTTIFPDQWKKALVIPIPKSGDPHKIDNYRPISLLPLPGKILEKIVHTQLSSHLEQNELLSNSQFGFRKQRSTAHAISQLLNQIYTNINRSVATIAVYIDFSKALNCVQHATLLNKLKHLSLSSNTLRWLENYLENREQRTLVNNVFSTSLPVRQGVPQGSVLGPLLYIIYANDIADRIKNSGYTFYADDTVLYSKKKSLVQAGIELQQDLDSLANWCVDNDIYINTKKTKVMFFGSRARISSTTLPELSIGGTILQRVKSYTYLGLKLDEQLNMETHANSLIQKVSNKIYHLTKVRYFITKKAALLIYKNMILPILEYGDIFLHSASQVIRKKLQTLPNKALRCALGKDKFENTTQLHNDARLLKLKTRRHVHVLLHMYQLAQMPDFKLWKTHQQSGTKTRSSKKKLITLRKPTNEKYKKSITYQGPTLWNLLPATMQKMDNYYNFKSQLTKLLHPGIGTKSKA